MDYEKTIPFSGDIKSVLEVVRNVFIQHSFQIVHTSESTLEMAGSGTMWTRGQAPLVGISKVSIRGAGSNLSIEAEFGGIRKAVVCMSLFILGLAVFFLIVFGIVFSLQGLPFSRIIMIALVPLAPWPVLIPIIAKWLKSRNSRALDVLLNNMAYLGRQ